MRFEAQQGAAADIEEPASEAQDEEQEEEEEEEEEEGSDASSTGSYHLEPAPSENRSFASTYWRPERTDRNANLSVIDERFASHPHMFPQTGPWVAGRLTGRHGAFASYGGKRF